MSRGPVALRAAVWWIAAVAHALPRREQAAWRSEWTAELTHASRAGCGALRLWLRAIGAPWDIVTLLRLAAAGPPAPRYSDLWAQVRVALAAGSLGLAAAGITAGVHAGLAAGVGAYLWLLFGAVGGGLVYAAGRVTRALAPGAGSQVMTLAGCVAGPLALAGMARLDLARGPDGWLAALPSLVLFVAAAGRAAWRIVAAIGAVVALVPQPACGRQAQPPDPDFDATVASPAYDRGTGPRVVIDQAHHNFHTAAGRYLPFANLLSNDGFRVDSGISRFDPASLAGIDVLVIANALGADTPAEAGRPAFAPDEMEALHGWVRQGGALLLVADHEPAGAAAADLASRFGVDMSTGRTHDDPHSDWTSGSPTWLVFQRDTGALILPHPITEGRDSTERVRRVVTFTGQSLLGPPGSVGFLALAASAQDRLPDGRDVPARGRAQGVAFELGRGRVVVLGEAGMLTAQIAREGGRTVRFGMTWPATDDKRLTLNVVRWLARLLP